MGDRRFSIRRNRKSSRRTNRNPRRNRKFPRRPTQIDDLPPCLIIDILSRLPLKALITSKLVCKSWSLLFSEPLFVRLQSARPPTCLISLRSELKSHLKRYKPVGGMAGKDFEFRTDVPSYDDFYDSTFECANSCRGLLCLGRRLSYEETYVCNPILGEYITLPIVKRETISGISDPSLRRVKSVLGFSSRSNQFKVLQVHYSPAASGYLAEIYTIGEGTRQWRSIGTAPCCVYDFPNDSVLNGSIHWADKQSQQIVFFDFESEQFGSLPSPPAWRDGRWSKFENVRVSVLDGCLCISSYYGNSRMEKWVMKEYGVEESWTEIFPTHLTFSDKCDGRFSQGKTVSYSPSFISLQDVAGSENLTVLSRTMYQYSREMMPNNIFQLCE